MPTATATQPYVTPEFDEATHTYTVNGETLPSVTQIIDALWLTPPYPEGAYKAFGSAVHKACEYDDLGCLDESQTHPAVMARVRGWRKLRRDLEFEILDMEAPMADPKRKFAGKRDRYVRIRDTGTLAVIDIKSGEPARAVELQTAAYAYLGGNPEAERYSARLDDDEGYRIRKHDNPNDFLVWQSCLDIFHSEPALKLWHSLAGRRELSYSDLLSCLAVWAWKKGKE